MERVERWLGVPLPQTNNDNIFIKETPKEESLGITLPRCESGGGFRNQDPSLQSTPGKSGAGFALSRRTWGQGTNA